MTKQGYYGKFKCPVCGVGCRKETGCYLHPNGQKFTTEKEYHPCEVCGIPTISKVKLCSIHSANKIKYEKIKNIQEAKKLISKIMNGQDIENISIKSNILIEALKQYAKSVNEIVLDDDTNSSVPDINFDTASEFEETDED